MEGPSAEVSIGFKKRSRKVINVRTKIKDEDPDDAALDEETISKLEETRLRQKIREKPKGISIAELAIGKKITLEEEVTAKDVFNAKSGGMVNMQAIKSGKFKQDADDAFDTGIGTQFSAETNKRDEDEEMMKYIEEQLQSKKGSAQEGGAAEEDVRKYMTPEEAALFSIPEHLRISSTQRSEEMLSNQMLSGIPEVDLGIDAKIKNIEATEEAKQKLLQEQKNRKDAPSHFVPNNMAVNYVQHNRFNVDDSRKRRAQEARPNQKPPNFEHKKKATDDFHYDKFRKQFRKH